jgi:hypothetical protein
MDQTTIEQAAKALPGYEEMLKTALVEMAKGLQSVSEFAKEQVPDVLRQLVVYNMIEAAILVLVLPAFATMCVVCAAKASKANTMYDLVRHNRAIELTQAAEGKTSGYYEMRFVMFLIGAILSGFGTLLCSAFAVVWAIPTLIGTIFAPKAWLLDKLLQALGSKGLL